MVSEAAGAVRNELVTLFSAGTAAGVSDGELLRAFAEGQGGRPEAAFEALVRRHGPMILRVCRRALRDEHDAEDAFQATFLLLASRGHSIRRPEALGSWLFGVAQRVTQKVRLSSSRRRAREQRRAEAPSTVEEAFPESEPWAELYEEIDRLPERYRVPIVLFYLEGLTAEDVSSRMSWPVGTVHSRLARGRERLRARLSRRGVALSAGSALVIGLPEPAPAALSETLVKASAALANGLTAGSATFAVLARHVLRAMLLNRLKASAFATLGAASLLGLGIGAESILLRTRAAAQGPPATAVAAADPPADASKTPAKAVTPKSPETKPNTPAKRRNGQPERRVLPITIEGRALDKAGKPIAGARINVTDANQQRRGGDPTLLGTTTSGPDGRYTFRGLSLPVWTFPDDPLSAAEEGKFQVAGTAPGFGFTWSEVFSYRPGPRPSDAKAGQARAAFYEGEPIEPRLGFEPPASLHGTLTDDRGNPIASAKVQVGYTDDPRKPNGWGTSHCNALDPNGGDGRSFGGIRDIPEDLRTTKSGPDGSYRFDGLPREATLFLQVDPCPAYDAFLTTFATTKKPTPNIQVLGFDGTLDRTFASPRDVPITVNSADTGTPAPGVTVRARGDALRRDGAVGRTNAVGKTVLHLVPGKYTLAIEPPFDSDGLLGERAIEVTKEAVARPIDIPIKRGAVVVVEATESGKSTPLAGVGVSYATDETHPPIELRSQTVFVDHPTTGRDGLLRAVVAPGRRRFVAKAPIGYQTAESTTPFLDLAAGTSTRVRFAFEAASKAAEGPGGSQVQDGGSGQRLRQIQQLHRQLTSRCRFRVRTYTVSTEATPPDDLRRLLRSLDSKSTPDLVKLLRESFTIDRLSDELRSEILVDGYRARQTGMERSGPGGFSPEVFVNNGKESIRYSGVNGQVDIDDRWSWGGMSFSDYCVDPYAPDAPNPLRKDTAITKVEHRDGRVFATREYTHPSPRGTSHQRFLTEADESSGFVYHHAERQDPSGHRRERWQFGPRTRPNGVTIPGVSVEFQENDGRLDTLFIRSLVDVDFDPVIAPDAFVVSAPAGALLLDYRGGVDHRDAYRGVSNVDEGDVLAWADRAARGRKPHRPLIEVGRPAPVLRPLTWLDRGGEIPAPKLEGKVVLVDFWGTGCGPCIAQLPRVREAVTHFEKTDLVVVGLHDSGANPKAVSEFAKARDLAYPIAIDRPSESSDGFGVTFNAFGVDSIPSAAVIDRQGRVAYVGTFDEALKRADKLLRPAEAR